MAPSSATPSASLCLLVLNLVASGRTFSSRVILRENGYEGVLIAVDERVPLSKCQEIAFHTVF
ncbi:hypothetical protein SK128_004676 [Halocaridina rubra]|uniref:Secreted protein n=1 Tax=Halocaridina rubra TaxID=373956 RepID=A0AAN8XTZ9_HALRR